MLSFWWDNRYSKIVVERSDTVNSMFRVPHNGGLIKETTGLGFNSNLVVSNNYYLLSTYCVPNTVPLLYVKHLRVKHSLWTLACPVRGE